MEAKNYHKYKIKLEHRSVASIEADGQKLRSFIEPDNRDELPKLYVVKSRAEVVYIGQTTQNMRDRLRQGLKAQGKSGYYGYMWKDLPEVGVLVWCFPREDEKYTETGVNP